VSEPPQAPLDPGIGSRFAREVGERARRKAQSRQDPGVWFSLAMMGLVGWSVAVPTLLGAALGVWLDYTWPARFSWTLTLLFVGVVLGCFNAWRWVRQEGTRTPHDRDPAA
jgi:ATP synthase protein I